MRRPARPRLRAIRPFTTGVVNPLTRRFVHFLPFFAVIGYRGRTSGRRYRTPMNVFRDGDDYIFALTYGSDVDWVQNVLAAGQADLQVRRRHIPLTDPELIIDPTRRLSPSRCASSWDCCASMSSFACAARTPAPQRRGSRTGWGSMPLSPRNRCRIPVAARGRAGEAGTEARAPRRR